MTRPPSPGNLPSQAVYQSASDVSIIATPAGPAPVLAPAPGTGVALATAPAASVGPRLLDRVRNEIRLRHYSIRTEGVYVDWIRRFIHFHGKRHPDAMGEAEVAAFLTDLAVTRHVAPATQAQAKSALLFLYRVVLKVEPRNGS